MKKGNLSYILHLTLVLLLITAVVAALLGLVDSITRDKIAAATREKLETSMALVLQADTYAPVENTPAEVAAVYEARTGDALTGYVIEVKPSGFGGEIDMLVGVDANCTVTGVSIISHGETSGLGAVAAANSQAGVSFRSQFAGTSGTLAVKKDGGKIDALTGATVTSRAVTDGVNTALACAGALLG
ncbi:MAG: RnfABCDGE type electron transport complex subunit G [Firmicutes bacterium]|nr:RnfABCDGE type electron transport complex subunit G [Bacillota bacterium]MDY2720424.1 RnfABCDGE type electron transport complex subunit G [Candidatus Faecousia sp.]